LTIKFCSLSSGSSGNCHYMETENIRILVDAGFSGRQVENLLDSIDRCPSTIDAIFVTHEHLDHVKGVGVLSRRYDIPIYANANTWIGMEKTIGNIREKNIQVFTSENYLNIKDLDIYPLKIFHDALEPVGYIVNYQDKKISLITDTGLVNNHMIEKIKDSNLYLLESNHDREMLRTSSYPWTLKQRIMGNKGHLSNDDAGRILKKIIKAKGEIILLGHLSRDNNLPDLAFKTVSDYLIDKGVQVFKDIHLGISYRNRATKVYSL